MENGLDLKVGTGSPCSIVCGQCLSEQRGQPVQAREAEKRKPPRWENCSTRSRLLAKPRRWSRPKYPTYLPGWEVQSRVLQLLRTRPRRTCPGKHGANPRGCIRPSEAALNPPQCSLSYRPTGSVPRQVDQECDDARDYSHKEDAPKHSFRHAPVCCHSKCDPRALALHQALYRARQETPPDRRRQPAA